MLHPELNLVNLTDLLICRDVEPAHFTLKYNLMPYVGALTYGEAARTEEPVPFPAVQVHVK